MDFHNAFLFAKGAVASSSHDNSGATFPWEKGPFAAIFSDDHADTLNQVSLSEVPLPKHRGIPSGTPPGTLLNHLSYDQTFLPFGKIYFHQMNPMTPTKVSDIWLLPDLSTLSVVLKHVVSHSLVSRCGNYSRALQLL